MRGMDNFPYHMKLFGRMRSYWITLEKKNPHMRTERDDAGRAGKKAAHSREDERKKREKEGAMVLY